MSYNIISYVIYLPITAWITIYVGKVCFVNGRAYLNQILHNRSELVNSINSSLLLGYYLLNIGYAATMLSFWPEIHDFQNLILELSRRIGLIIISLGLMHYFNLTVTYLISKKINKQSQLKTSSS
ncbi:MAG: hypothetical protein R2852_00125 [Bacteroidia bacterium]